MQVAYNDRPGSYDDNSGSLSLTVVRTNVTPRPKTPPLPPRGGVTNYRGPFTTTAPVHFVAVASFCPGTSLKVCAMAIAVLLLVLIAVIVVAASTFTTRPLEVSVLLLITIASTAALAVTHSRLAALAVAAIPLVVFFTLKSIVETVGLITATRHPGRPRRQASSADGRDDSRLAD